MQPGYQPPFELIDFVVVVEHRQGRGILAEATVKVRVGEQVIHTAAEGNGPVSALDAALRKALLDVYPALAHVRLADYKVRILDSESGTGRSGAGADRYQERDSASGAQWAPAPISSRPAGGPWQTAWNMCR